MHLVATSFLVRNKQYLLLKRSNLVSTMQGKWSAVSGTINEGEPPLERAYTEILEETRIERKHLRLLNEAPPMDVYSSEHKSALQVYGFAFECATDKVCLNWENVEYRWVLRSEIGLLDTVLRLGDILDALI